MTTKPSPNDQRSDVKNPNNPAYEADQENREAQKDGTAPKAPAPTTEPKKP